jgi:hypothetical protein
MASFFSTTPSSDKEDFLLPLFHSRYIILQRGHLVPRSGGIIPQEFRYLGPVCGILMNSQLEVLRELLIKFLVVLSVFSDFGKELKALLGDVLFDDFQDLVLLKEFSGDVEGQILGVDHSLDEAQVVGDEVLTIVHNKNSSNIKFDVVLLFLGFKKVKWSPFWYK